MRWACLVLLALSASLARGADQPDDAAELRRLFAAAAEKGGVVTIPPGEYRVGNGPPIPLASNTTVFAHQCRFVLPERLGDKARVVVFEGRDIRNFAWHGGEFIGRVFDPEQRENAWEPNVNTRVFVLSTSSGGTTRDILFRDVRANGIAGAVINVEGIGKKKSEGEVDTFAERVRVENCTLLRSGRFMWDYGYLWQIVVWPEDYEPWEVERAQRYFRTDLVRDVQQMAAGDDRVQFDNTRRPIAVSTTDQPRESLCFFGGTLPKNIVRGRQYFVVETGKDYVKIADKPHAPAMRFDGAAGQGVKLAHTVSAVHLGLYSPTNAGPGKGGVDVQCCRDVQITGCQLSALGDTMHVHRCHNVVFANNHIIGSRMGAFFLAEFCRNATIVGNLVDGTNGSRVMSVEKSCTDVTIIGNTFRNGGRGAWINQPRNFILQGNVFVNNTTKGEHDPRRGRRSFITGGWERFPELYFTTHEENGQYGPVIVRDNIFVLGEFCASDAVTFAPGGSDLQMSGNSFQGRPAGIRVDPTCTGVDIRDNPNAELKRGPVGVDEGRRTLPD